VLLPYGVATYIRVALFQSREAIRRRRNGSRSSLALVDELTDALEATQAAVVLSTHDRQLLRDVDD
jgi:hypothetical protein